MEGGLDRTTVDRICDATVQMSLVLVSGGFVGIKPEAEGVIVFGKKGVKGIMVEKIVVVFLKSVVFSVGVCVLYGIFGRDTLGVIILIVLEDGGVVAAALGPEGEDSFP